MVTVLWNFLETYNRLLFEYVQSSQPWSKLTAKSTRCSFPMRTWFWPSGPFSLHSTVMVKMAWERDDLSFMFVAPTEPIITNKGTDWTNALQEKVIFHSRQVPVPLKSKLYCLIIHSENWSCSFWSHINALQVQMANTIVQQILIVCTKGNKKSRILRIWILMLGRVRLNTLTIFVPCCHCLV